MKLTPQQRPFSLEEISLYVHEIASDELALKISAAAAQDAELAARIDLLAAITGIEHSHEHSSTNVEGHELLADKEAVPGTPHTDGTNPSQSIYECIAVSARQLYESQPDWVTFFREILGIDGVVRRQFTKLEDLTAFEQSPEFEQIQKWLVELREIATGVNSESEPTRVITVRIPSSMHAYLQTEANDLRTSMNKLCISKLLQCIEQDLVPLQRGVMNVPSENVNSSSILHVQADELFDAVKARYHSFNDRAKILNVICHGHIKVGCHVEHDDFDLYEVHQDQELFPIGDLMHQSSDKARRNKPR